MRHDETKDVVSLSCNNSEKVRPNGNTYFFTENLVFCMRQDETN